MLPRKIFSLWVQGEELAPPIVRMNFDRWRALNPSFDLEVLSGNELDSWIHDTPAAREISIQAKSDILRIRLLSEYGGIWIDASVFPVVPLDRWIDDAVSHNDFFAYTRPEPEVALSSWFLAANPNSKLISKWEKLVTQYWSIQRPPRSETRDLQFLKDPLNEMRPFDEGLATPYPYFWFHHLFSILLQTNTEAQEIWNARQIKPFEATHILQNEVAKLEHRQQKPRKNLLRRLFPRDRPRNSEFLEWIYAAEMQKLDWRCNSYPTKLMKNLPI
ncbi:MAG: capsular polysaccharide synthesis protein [Dinoroseobacter sp.]|nr:capsular polysaccharide synthesis protein [Dinoroseobacter sp.]